MDAQLTDSFSENRTPQTPPSNLPDQFPNFGAGGFSPLLQPPQVSDDQNGGSPWKPIGFLDTSESFPNQNILEPNINEDQNQDSSMPKVTSFIQTSESPSAKWFQSPVTEADLLVRKTNTPPSIVTSSGHSVSSASGGGASSVYEQRGVFQDAQSSPQHQPVVASPAPVFTPGTFQSSNSFVPTVPDFFNTPNFSFEPEVKPETEKKVEDQLTNFIPNATVTVPESDLQKSDFSFLSPGTPLKVPEVTSIVMEVEVSKIRPNPYQPRKYFEPNALNELAESIREHGIVQPIVLTQNEDHYEIVVGERRFRASQLAGLQKVPAIVKIGMEDQTKLEVALIENIQRQELNPIEEAKGYERLAKQFNLTQDQIAKKVGKSRSSIANTLRLLQLPEVIQVGVSEGKISEGHARAMLTIEGAESQVELYSQTIHQGLNVRQIETKAKEMIAKKGFDLIGPDPHVMALENELRTKFGTQVKIQKQGRGGKITIEFFSDEELDALVHRIKDQTENPIDQTTPQGYFTV
jgi:ParB family chromosome partitioning protein